MVTSNSGSDLLGSDLETTETKYLCQTTIRGYGFMHDCSCNLTSTAAETLSWISCRSVIIKTRSKVQAKVKVTRRPRCEHVIWGKGKLYGVGDCRPYCSLGRCWVPVVTSVLSVTFAAICNANFDWLFRPSNWGSKRVRSAKVTLDMALLSSYRLCLVTILLSLAVWPKFAMQFLTGIPTSKSSFPVRDRSPCLIQCYLGPCRYPC